jgi:DNA-binding MarR family transcriptional regulator
MEDGLVASEANPRHARSPFYVLTRTGTSVYAATERVQTAWANRLADSFSVRNLETTKQLLDNLSNRLTRS